jgi:hypothetical protein
VAVFFPKYVFGTFVNNQMMVAAWVYLSSSTPLVYMSILMSVPGCFSYNGCVVSFEVGYYDTISSAVFAQDFFGYSGSFMLSFEF